MAGLSDIRNGREYEFTEIVKQRHFVYEGGVSVLSEIKNLHGFSVIIKTGNVSGSKNQYISAISDAFKILSSFGFHKGLNKKIIIYLSDHKMVKNIAFMNGENITIFLGSRIKNHMSAAKPSKKPPSVSVKGGVTAGVGRARGIADYMYDVTSRQLFKNPKESSMIKAVVIHEMGHALHEHFHPEIFWDLKRESTAQAYNSCGWINASFDVSQYATTNALEFVAETFTGMSLGEKYGKIVESAYSALGGPQ
ncbi:hypothetical protein [Microbulbifer sp. GL-2]|uniref:hypothetical protein n=1 Tax=Microbulbifer sp. GL-2 TaxID=2591606 RepID=UPI001162141E|nr:hypothetical protein [Microbulbifer sp. GL-2]BBM03798.1 hypothetical protein GL2_38720 [Microbulbifer sp. GL-2]